jgi:hypothetical protein
MVVWIAVGGFAGLLGLAGLTGLLSARAGERPVLQGRLLPAGSACPGVGGFGPAVAGGWHGPFKYLEERPGEGGAGWEGGRAGGFCRP